MSTAYRLDFPPGYDHPTLSVIETKTYKALGPLSFGTDPSGRSVWHMDFGMSITTHTPTCDTVEEMLEKGWIEEVAE